MADVSSVADRIVSRGRDLRVLDGHVVPRRPAELSALFPIRHDSVRSPPPANPLCPANAGRRLAACPVLDDPVYIL